MPMRNQVGGGAIPPLYRPFDPDSSPEFHAARLLLLINQCGEGRQPSQITGRTKLAKLDFFARYPEFLERALGQLRIEGLDVPIYTANNSRDVEAPMIRYLYGPWDPRYRDFLAYLQARKLILVDQRSNTTRYRISAKGRGIAVNLEKQPSYADLAQRVSAIAETFADWGGSQLKDLIYRVFPEEVGSALMRAPIAPQQKGNSNLS